MCGCAAIVALDDSPVHRTAAGEIDVSSALFNVAQIEVMARLDPVERIQGC
jgi:hypothetical protein